MAKKKQSGTLEELLEQALVSESEQPYEVPENWVWVKLPTVFQNVTSSKLKLQQKEYLEEGEYQVIDQGQEFVGGYTNDSELLYKDDLPVVVFGDHTRIVKYVNFPFVQGADGVKILKVKAFMESKCFYYMLRNLNIADLGYRRHFPLFPTYSVPIPPLSEQQRIVDRIESLFEKLDQAKGLIQDALDSFENRKAAILHKAFSGELTRKWREENGVGMESWEEKRFEEFCFLNRGFDLPSSQRTSGEYDLVTSSGVTDSHNQSKVKGPGVVTGRSGTIGKVYYIENDYWPLNTTLYSKKTYNNNTKFIYYYLKNFDFKQYSSSTAVPTLNRNNFSDVVVLIPSVEEQSEIVRILDSLLVSEENSSQLCNEIGSVDLMKKSILARAFRGELGTNDPGEESALALLKEVLGKVN